MKTKKITIFTIYIISRSFSNIQYQYQYSSGKSIVVTLLSLSVITQTFLSSIVYTDSVRPPCKIASSFNFLSCLHTLPQSPDKCLFNTSDLWISFISISFYFPDKNFNTALPTFWFLPDFVNGTPNLFDIFDFWPDIPKNFDQLKPPLFIIYTPIIYNIPLWSN